MDMTNVVDWLRVALMRLCGWEGLCSSSPFWSGLWSIWARP